MPSIKEAKILIMATDGFEQSELLRPKRALEEAGATAYVVSPKSGAIRGWKEADWGDEVEVDIELSQARPEDFDGLVLPGGQINPDVLRLDQAAVGLVRSMVEAGKPVGAICHGPWLLIEADAVRGLTATSYPSIREVVVDQGIVTSRKPADLPAFCAKLIEEIAEGHHAARAVA